MFKRSVHLLLFVCLLPFPSLYADAIVLPVPGTMVHLSPSYAPPILKGIKVHPENPFRFEFILDKGTKNRSQPGDIVPVGATATPGSVSPGTLPSELAMKSKAPEGTNQSRRSNPQTEAQLKEESTKLIKYFLASLTTPEKDLWVNLSPYEKDRIVPDSFGQTEMGRDLLAQDYILKQITASLIYPEGEVGKKFWKRVYEEARRQSGDMSPRERCPQAGCQATNGVTSKAPQGNTPKPKSTPPTINLNMFNKVWIVPNKAVVYENAKAGTAYVVESSLKVMLAEDYEAQRRSLASKAGGLEEDYLAINKNRSQPGDMMLSPQVEAACPQAGCQTSERLSVKASQGNNRSQTVASQIVREVVLPQLTKEINEGQNFAQLRQVYNSLILATWYKKKIKDSILNQVYADKNKIKGTQFANSLDVQAIYQRYLQAFKKGAYSYIKEESDPVSEQRVARKYFSGGFNMAMAGVLVLDYSDKAMSRGILPVPGILQSLAVTLIPRTSRETFTDRLASRDAINVLLPDGGTVIDIGLGENAVTAIELTENRKLNVIGVDIEEPKYETDLPSNYSFVRGDLFHLPIASFGGKKAKIIRIANVIYPHYYLNTNMFGLRPTEKAIVKALSQVFPLLEDGGVVLIGWGTRSVGEEYIVYKKEGGRILLKDYVFSYVEPEGGFQGAFGASDIAKNSFTVFPKSPALRFNLWFKNRLMDFFNIDKDALAQKDRGDVLEALQSILASI